MTFQKFKHIIYNFSIANRLNILSFSESSTSKNFHSCKIIIDSNEIYILCSTEDDWAITDSLDMSVCEIDFVNNYLFSDYLLKNYNIEVLIKSELDKPFLNNPNLNQSDVNYWNPKTVGESLFNWWD